MSPQTLSDWSETREGLSELVFSCLRKDGDAWKQFVETYSPLIRRLVRQELRRCLQSTRCSQDIEDLVENVILSLMDQDGARLREYDTQYAFTTWLGVLTKTAVHRHLRKKRPALLASPDQRTAPEAAPESPLDAQESIEAVHQALATLPGRDRLLISLFYFDEADYRQIARLTGLHMNSVGAALHRARQRLKAELLRREHA